MATSLSKRGLALFLLVLMVIGALTTIQPARATWDGTTDFTDSFETYNGGYYGGWTTLGGGTLIRWDGVYHTSGSYSAYQDADLGLFLSFDATHDHVNATVKVYSDYTPTSGTWIYMIMFRTGSTISGTYWNGLYTGNNGKLHIQFVTAAEGWAEEDTGIALPLYGWHTISLDMTKSGKVLVRMDSSTYESTDTLWNQPFGQVGLGCPSGGVYDKTVNQHNDDWYDEFVLKGAGAATYWYIDSSAGSGGSIAPSGSIAVLEGEDQNFTISPSTNYVIDDVLVDSVSQGNVTSYLFEDVIANHTISASFTYVPQPPQWYITSSAGTGGTIAPAGVTVVPEGDNQRFNITASTDYAINDVVIDGTTHVGAVDHYIFNNVLANHTIVATFSYIPPPDIIGIGPEYVPVGTNVIGGGPDGQLSVVTSAGYCYTVSVKPYNTAVTGYRQLTITWIGPDGTTHGYDEVTLSQGLIGWVGSGPAWVVTGLTMTAYTSTKVIIACGVYRGGSAQVVPVVFQYEAGHVYNLYAPAGLGYAPSTGFQHLMGATTYTPTVTGSKGDAGVLYYRFVYVGDYYGNERVSVIRYRPSNGEVLISNLTADHGGSPSFYAGSFPDPNIEGVYYMVSTVVDGDTCDSSFWLLDLNSTVATLTWVRDGYPYSDHLSPYYTSEYKFLGGGVDPANGIIYYTIAYETGLDIGYNDYVIRQERFKFLYDPFFWPYAIDDTVLWANETGHDSRAFAYSSDVGGWFNAMDAKQIDYRTFEFWVANPTTWMKKSLIIPDWVSFYGQNIGDFVETASQSESPYWMTAGDSQCGRLVIPYPVGSPLYGQVAVIDHARTPLDGFGTSLVYYEHYTPTTISPPSSVFALFINQALTPNDIMPRVSTVYNFKYTVTNNTGAPYAGHDFTINVTKPSGSIVMNRTTDSLGQFDFSDTANVSDAGLDWTIYIEGDNFSGGINDHTFTIHWFPNVVLSAITLTPAGGPYVGTAYTYHCYVTVDGVPFVGTVSLIEDSSYPAVSTYTTANGHAYMAHTQAAIGVHTFRAEVTIGLYTYSSATISKTFTVYVAPPPDPFIGVGGSVTYLIDSFAYWLPALMMIGAGSVLFFLFHRSLGSVLVGANIGMALAFIGNAVPAYTIVVFALIDVGFIMFGRGGGGE